MLETSTEIFKIGQYRDDLEYEKKVWDNIVDGMISVFVDPESSDAIMFHMLIDWTQEVKVWCTQNCSGKYVFGHFSYLGPYVYFDLEEDAVAFKLMWT